LQASIGEALFETGAVEESLSSYRAALADADRLGAADRDNAQWQINLALTYLNLGLRGDDQSARLQSALGILRKLKVAQKLTPEQEALLAKLEVMFGPSSTP
jgi:hypothetical protein